MHVKVLFPEIAFSPTLLHLAPALVVECAGTMERDIKRENIDRKPTAFLFIRRNTIQEVHKTKDSLIYFSLALSESVVKAAMNASCGTSTRPTIFIRFLPSFCFSSNLRFRVISPP